MFEKFCFIYERKVSKSLVRMKVIESSRLKWADIAKGIGIVLVVWGHSSLPFEFRKWIYSFHMPLFFILSGYFYKSQKYGFTDFVLRKVRTLIIPYFFFGLLTWFLLSFINISEFSPHTLKGFLISGAGNEPIWFLFTLFLVSVIHFLLDYILSFIKNKRKRIYAWVFVCLCCLMLSHVLVIEFHYYPAYHLNTVPHFLFFYILGWLKLVEGRTCSWKVLLSLLVVDIFFEHNLPYGIGTSENIYYWLLSYVLAFVGSSIVIGFSKKLACADRSVFSKIIDVIAYFGRNSIIVLGLHHVLVQIIKLVFSPLLLPDYVSFPIRQIFLWMILTLLISLLNKYTPFLIGKK